MVLVVVVVEVISDKARSTSVCRSEIVADGVVWIKMVVRRFFTLTVMALLPAFPDYHE